MNKLPYNVIIFDKDDEPTSRCMFPTERAARKRYVKALMSAPCANVGRIQLTKIAFPHVNVLQEWTRWNSEITEPEKSDIQTAGYIVHSVRSVNGTTTAHRSTCKTFYETEDQAVRNARQLADKWKLGHEGLIVFKAIKHVQKVEWTPRPGSKIRVSDV